MRSSARKRDRNRSVKSRLKTLEKSYLETVKSGKKDNAGQALRQVVSALDKAAKTGIIHQGRASRKKSRLTHRLNQLAPKA